LNFTNIIPI